MSATQADQMVYQTEKTLDEHGRQARRCRQGRGRAASSTSLKTALNGTDTEAIKKATEELTQAFYKVSEKMYQQANPQGAQGNPGAGYTDPGAQQGQQQGGQYYDADYEVVDDDKDKK